MQDSFKNWRGMSESQGRRIKRHVSIDINSVRFCDDELLQRFEEIDLIAEYVKQRRVEIDAYNKEKLIDAAHPINGRRMTNIGTFRRYVEEYLLHHDQIHQGMTLLVRQLAPTERGVPIEIYCFSKDKTWAGYEGIQGDIFDHLFAILPEFGLRAFQNPTGHDMQQFARA